MNLMTLQIDEDEAKAKLAEYQQALQLERNSEDEAIAAGYRAAARGLPVVLLSRVFELGGWFDHGLPRLAIARADATTVRVEIEGLWGSGPLGLVFHDDDRSSNRGALVGKHTVRVQMPRRDHAHNSRRAGRTTVPLIPPRHRPRRPRLHTHHVLWEVEAWDPTPPRDPALLRHIRGDLWAVVATWDLTDLERAVLSQRS